MVCPNCYPTGLIIEVQGPQQTSGSTYNQSVSSLSVKEAGLCILLMDASGSMGEEAFMDYSFPSKYGNEKLTKREMISDVAAKAIFDLKTMTLADDAYICAIKFDHRQAVMFTKTISGIISEFGTVENLSKYMYDELAAMNGGTDINSAFTMAQSFMQKFLDGTVPGLGNYTPLEHTQFVPRLNKSILVPNVRVLIYTDGQQLADYGALNSPFRNMEPDLLMGAYIGQQGEPGCNELKSVLGKCPVHNSDQFFVLDAPQKIAALKGLFRMASGTSGFCPTCITPI